MTRLRTLSLPLAMLGALLALALVVAGCGGNNSSDQQSGAEAKAALIAALRNTAALKTGDIQLAGKFGSTGGSSTASLGNVTLAGNGQFDVSDPANPKLDLKVNVGLASQTQEIGLIVVDKKAYIEVAGQTVELGSSSNKSVRQLTDTLGPQAIGRLNSQFETNVTDVRTTGTETVGGKKLTIYSAKIDFNKVLDAFSSGKSGSGSLLSGLTGASATKSKNAFVAKTVQFGVDDSGKVVRHIHIVAEFNDPTDKSAKGTFDLDLKLLPATGTVNITAPKNAIKAGGGALGGLLNSFGGGQ